MCRDVELLSEGKTGGAVTTLCAHAEENKEEFWMMPRATERREDADNHEEDVRHPKRSDDAHNRDLEKRRKQIGKYLPQTTMEEEEEWRFEPTDNPLKIVARNNTAFEEKNDGTLLSDTRRGHYPP